MDLAPIVARMAEVTDFAGRVFPARDLATAVDYVTQRTPAGLPSGIVFAMTEKAEPSDIIGGVRHLVEATFGAMTCIRYAGNAEAAYEQLDTLRAAVMGKFLGWVPATGYRELQFAQGSLAYSEVGLILWSDTFRTEYYLEA